MASRALPSANAARRGSPSAATSARASASGPAKAPNTLTCSGGVVISRLAASASGASGAHACQAAIAAAGSSQNVSNAVITGSRTVAISSAVTTPKRAAARAAQRPQQVVVGLDHAPVGEHHLGGANAVRSSPYVRPRIPRPPPRASPATPTSCRSRRRSSARARRARRRSRRAARPRRRAPRRRRPRSPSSGETSITTPLGRGAAREAVAAAADGERQPGGLASRDRRGDVLRARARRDPGGPDTAEAGERRSHPRIKRKATRREPLGEPSRPSAEASGPSGWRAFRPQASLFAAATFASGTNLDRPPAEIKSA